MTETAVVISDPLRVPIVAVRREAGGVVLRRGARFMALHYILDTRKLLCACGIRDRPRGPFLGACAAAFGGLEPLPRDVRRAATEVQDLRARCTYAPETNWPTPRTTARRN